ncbi:Acetylornithine deacetylase [Castellaniella defragrans]
MTPQSLAMIRRLVAFDTVSRNSNLDLVHDVRDYLAGFGIESHLIPGPREHRSNLFATVGPQVTGGVVLSGHTDVVPVDGQPWETDPFIVTEKNGRLYGRGTSDMKSFIAVALAMVPDMLAAGLASPIHLALSCDEEVGCLGAPAMIARMEADQIRPRSVIVGEPTSMRPIVAHKGVTVLRTTVVGLEAHSSQVQDGVNAVTLAARLIAFIDDMMSENREATAPSCRFVPPYTTLQTGVVRGGTASNIVARTCTFEWDIRALPGEDWRTHLTRFEAYAQSLLPALRTISPDASITTEVLAAVPPLQDQGGEAQQLVFELTQNHAGEVVPYGAEAGQFQQSGFSVVLCGPGSIDQAHKPNEYIDISQISACEAFFGRLLKRLSA